MQTFAAEVNPEIVISELTYSCYAFNRDDGMSAERLLTLFPETGDVMEVRYLEEQWNSQH